ncbi:hypothetical protein H8N03_01140 [Ramlibacter sp. USB13]|uniref:Uncharacterized protein n=1 Tax=Ramlibacter cellulosilyticus TaxID=2764187 RepID=A0A923SD34_9BURK|nr:hypothetical protein [Ramlibacter cellulosilyticus]MBC5781527.1 hypothetical protein [Ramlibacter cellulosilyticus]
MSKTTHFLFFAAASLAAPAFGCDLPDVQASVNEALGARERAGATVTRAVRDDLLKKSCDAAKQVVEERRATTQVVAGKLPNVVAKHLESQLDPSASVQTVSALLRKELGASGLFRPAARTYAIVKVAYQVKADWIDVAGERFNPARAELVVPIGAFRLAGFVGGTQVCRAEATVAAGQPETITCSAR